METPKRFTDAVTKLYTAFHEGNLYSNNCSACAVGNIIGHGRWRGSSYIEYVERNIPCIKRIYLFEQKNDSGYSLEELAMVEYLFIKCIGDQETKENHFKGLCSVVKYLCELDNIPNVMDIQSLFEYKGNQPKKQLSEVL